MTIGDFSSFFEKPYLEVKNIELPWRKISTCCDCCDNYLACLFCYSQYKNIRIFKDSIDISDDYDLGQDELSPEASAYPDWGQ